MRERRRPPHRRTRSDGGHRDAGGRRYICVCIFIYIYIYIYISASCGVIVLSELSTSAVAIRSQPPKPASLRDAGVCCPLWWC